MSTQVQKKLTSRETDQYTIRVLVRSAGKSKSAVEDTLNQCEWLSKEAYQEIQRLISTSSDDTFTKGGVSAWPESPSKVTVVWSLGEEVQASPSLMFELLSGCKLCLGGHFSKTKNSIALKLEDSLHEDIRLKVSHAFTSFLSCSTYNVKSFKKEKKNDTAAAVKDFNLLVVDSNERSHPKHKESIHSAEVLGEGNNFVRILAERPANDLNVKNYVKECQEFAEKAKLSFKFYGIKDLEKRKAGAFLAVAQGCSHKESGIVEVHHKPKGAKFKVALVGKGLCYDTGGVNLKGAQHMFGMHGDMTGSAVALSSIIAFKKLLPDIEFKAFLAITDNAIDAASYRPNEVVVASNGLSIEVVHTDAEGRMALADTLVLASEFKPDLMIDFATLTGSAVGAIGTNYSAVFTNDEKYHESLRAAGKQSGERVWPFPMDADYGESLKSRIADIKQCVLSSSPDHIEAALFLKKFVDEKIPWVHVDLSACEREGGLAHISTKTTGFGMRFAYELIRNWTR